MICIGGTAPRLGQMVSTGTAPLRAPSGERR
jgi:hypothetical protein